eukprot:CAMPEP_0170590520 /NCGR_PEP_ID=MMETSP0224-20130122/11915_1 /TAXON_ID=285029 /ORGANISM="Togula jolla, Strain CCCM 725" /LENGTH=272 /DNA_ID=CAMNT_0010914325 /DNA_START=205 /DNA_END=1024 /DNA_ORIENTATION=-
MASWKGESLRNKAPLWKYLAISFSSVSASSCQYEALRFVSFPVQMLGKSFKMLPVMVWGMIVAGKRYSMLDWIVALSVTAGGGNRVLDDGAHFQPQFNQQFPWSLAAPSFLLLDGFTSTFQEKLFKDHTTSKYNQMVYINLGSGVISLISLIISGSLGSALAFAEVHPDFLVDAGFLSAAAVGGQWFIYSQVKEFGALVFAATMNVRQVVSILISYAIYGHSITNMQLLGLAMVFGTLFYKSFSSLVPREEKKALVKHEASTAPKGNSNSKV